MGSAEIIKLLENVAVPIAHIEKKIGIPATVLQKSIKGKRDLPKKWAIALKNYVATKQYLVGNAQIEYKKADKKSYDGKKLENVNDEPVQPSGLTAFQIYQRKKMGLK